jgi:hypothetical protein
MHERQIVEFEAEGFGISNRDAPRVTGGRVTAREWEILKVCNPLKVQVGSE